MLKNGLYGSFCLNILLYSQGFSWAYFGAAYGSLSNIKNEQTLPKIVINIPNSLALQFGENFMKIGTKNSKVTDVYIHTLVHTFVSNYNCQCNYTDVYYGFKSDNLKWRPCSF